MSKLCEIQNITQTPTPTPTPTPTQKDGGTDIFFAKNECVRVREDIIKRKIGGEFFL